MNSALGRTGKFPKYTFKYIPPKQNLKANIVPFEEWKSSTLFNIWDQ